VLRLNSRLGSGGEEPFHSFVPKPFDCHAYECNLYGYRRQPARPRGPVVRELRSTDRRLAGSIPQAWRGGKFPPRGLPGLLVVGGGAGRAARDNFMAPAGHRSIEIVLKCVRQANALRENAPNALIIRALNCAALKNPREGIQ